MTTDLRDLAAPFSPEIEARALEIMQRPYRIGAALEEGRAGCWRPVTYNPAHAHT